MGDIPSSFRQDPLLLFLITKLNPFITVTPACFVVTPQIITNVGSKTFHIEF